MEDEPVANINIDIDTAEPSTSTGGIKRKRTDDTPVDKRAKVRANNKYNGDLTHALGRAIWARVEAATDIQNPFATCESTTDCYRIVREVLGYTRRGTTEFVPIWGLGLGATNKPMLPKLTKTFLIKNGLAPAISDAEKATVTATAHVPRIDTKWENMSANEKAEEQTRIKAKQAKEKVVFNGLVGSLAESPDILGSRKVRLGRIIGTGGPKTAHMDVSFSVCLSDVLLLLNNIENWESKSIPRSLPDSDIRAEILSRHDACIYPPKLRGDKGFPSVLTSLGAHGCKLSQNDKSTFLRVLGPLDLMYKLITIDRITIQTKKEINLNNPKRNQLISFLLNMCPGDGSRVLISYMKHTGFTQLSCNRLGCHFLHTNVIMSRPTWRLVNVGTPKDTDEQYWINYNKTKIHSVIPEVYYVVMLDAACENIEVLDKIFMGSAVNQFKPRSDLGKEALNFDDDKILKQLNARQIYWNPIMRGKQNANREICVSSCYISQDNKKMHNQIDVDCGLAVISWEEVSKALKAEIDSLKELRVMFNGMTAMKWNTTTLSFSDQHPKMELTREAKPFRKPEI